MANAGIAVMGIPIIDVTEADFDRINAVNHKGTFLYYNKPPNTFGMADELFKFLQQALFIQRQDLVFMHQAKQQVK